MKEQLFGFVRAAPSPGQGRNVAREFVQARILAGLQRTGAMIPLAFHGGTALRFLYLLPRYSEDLDFALERTATDWTLRDAVRAILSDLQAEGYTTDGKVSDRRTVHSAFIRFPGLLHECGLSPQRSETLAVKIEVDTRPPAGAVLATTLVRRYVTLHLQHHDRASLLAGKLHAVLQRPYLKGRDIFDLVWYLADRNWPPPNFTMLDNALRQTGYEGPPLRETTWRRVVRKRVAALDWTRVEDDLRPFLPNAADAELVTRDNLLRLLRG